MIGDPPFLIRVDGSESTGLGHVSRCSALTERLSARGIRSLFVGTYTSDAREIIADAGGEVVGPANGADLASLAGMHRARTIVVDGYEFDAAFIERLAPAMTGRPLVLIDDFAGAPRYPDNSVILNFTIRAEELDYTGNRLRLFRGPRYLPIRGAISALRGTAGGHATGSRVLISLGNGEWTRLALRTALAVSRIAPEARIRLVGSPRPVPPPDDVAGLQTFPATASLAPHFAWADSCITGGGLTKYEACYLGLPTVAIPRTVGEEWDTRGFVSNGLALELARDASTESLATSLHTLIADRFTRRALADACATTFTRDCTETASAAILDEIDRSPEEDAVGAG